MTAVGVALLGFGNVGRAFARYLAAQPAGGHGLNLEIRAIADSTGAKIINDHEQLAALTAHKEAGATVAVFPGLPAIRVAEFIGSLHRFGVDVLVESLPTDLAGGQPALDLIKQALEGGTSVVTVDKGPLVRGFESLRQVCAEGAKLAYAGTTGVWPTEPVRKATVVEIRAVLNGTTNYILTTMQQQGVSFEKALAEAQDQGVAEPDPLLDIEGWDAACKILILAKTLMGAAASLEDVSRIGIGSQVERLLDEAQASGRIVRLVGRARIWQGRVRVSVAPKLVDPSSPFYSINGTSKAAVFTTRELGEIVCVAHSGRDAISKIILDDITEVCRV